MIKSVTTIKGFARCGFAAAMVVLLLASCSTSDDVATGTTGVTEPTEPAPVAFNTDISIPSSRATIGSIDNLDALKASGDGFGVFAYLTDDQKYATKFPNAAAFTSFSEFFMYNQQVTWGVQYVDEKGNVDPSDDEAHYDWVYRPLKYWPNSTNNTTNRYISFFAYAPYVEEEGAAKGITGYTNSTDRQPHIVYEIADGNEQVDLLYANCVDATRNGNGLITPTKPEEKYQKIPLTFHHALAALDIYEMGINATAGQVLNGSLVGKRSARSGFIYAMVKGGTYSDGFDVTVTNGNEPEALDLGIDEVAGYYCDYVVVKNAEITSDKKKAVVGGDELPLYDRFKLSLVNDLKADGTKYDFYGLMYDGGATYGAELVVTKVTLAGGGDIVDDPATPVANVEALLGLESPSTNLELTLTDAQVLIVDNNYIYVRENGKAICFYQVNAVKEVVKNNSILNGKINVDYEVYKSLPEVKTNKNTTADNLTVT